MHHIHTAPNTTKNNICLIDLTSELYERPDQNVSIHAHIHIHTPPNTTKKYMHHQIPPKNKICLVGLTSEVYERPDQYERSLLNNMFYVLSVKSTVDEKRSAFHQTFMRFWVITKYRSFI